MPITLETISGQTTTLSQSAYRYLRNAIVTLRLEPGMMVSESELAAPLEVSRTPIREALRMLLSDDLIQVLPQRGIRIAYISRRKTEEAVFVRRSLEHAAFRELAKNWKPSIDEFETVRREIENTFEHQRRAYNKKNLELFLQADESFHQTVLLQSKNQILLNVLFGINGNLTRARLLALKEMEHFRTIIDEHQRIFEAVSSHNGRKAVDLIDHHLDRLVHQLPELAARHPGWFEE